MPRVIWSNGQVDEAPTWAALLERVRKSQVRIVNRRSFRSELGHRAFVWSGSFIDVDCDARDLFEQLEDARLLHILPDDDDLTPTPWFGILRKTTRERLD